MKTGIAAVLILAGFSLLYMSSGDPKIPESQELSEEDEKRLGEVTSSLHGAPGVVPEDAEAKAEELRELEVKMNAAVTAQKKKKKMAMMSGIGSLIVGLGVAAWDIVARKKAGG